MTVGVPSTTAARTELVVPRSMPMTGSTLARLERLEQSARLLVLGVRLQQGFQRRLGLALLGKSRLRPRQEELGLGRAGSILHRPRRPRGRGGEIAQRDRDAGCAQVRRQAV